MPAYYMSDPMLSIKDRTEKKTNKALVLIKLVVFWGIEQKKGSLMKFNKHYDGGSTRYFRNTKRKEHIVQAWRSSSKAF